MRVPGCLSIFLFASIVVAQVPSSTDTSAAGIAVHDTGPAEVTQRLLTMIQEFGQNGEVPGVIANALGLTDAAGTPWPFLQIAAREIEPDSSTPLHVYAVNRGSDSDVVIVVEDTKTIRFLRAHRDGRAIAAVVIDKEANKASILTESETGALLTAELGFWNRKAEETVHWWTCMGELAGAQQVTSDKKAAACDWLIASGKEVPAGLALAYANRGMANREDEQKDLADLDMAVKIDPSCAYAWAMLCTELTRFGKDLDRALQSCDKSVDLNPDSADGWTHRGDIYLKRGEYRKAIAEYDVSLRINPDWMWTHISRGEAYARLGDLDDAVVDFSAAIRLHPDYSVGHFERGVARMLENDLDGALTDFQDGFGVDPKCGSCLVGKGLIEIRKGDRDAGAADVARGKSITPKTADDFSPYGIALPQI